MRKHEKTDGNITRWKPPREGFFKVNVDAAVLGEMGCGLGVIIRDHDGHIERAGDQQTRERWEAEIAEAKTMEFGLRMALQMGIVSIVAESDCKTLVNMLKLETLPSSYLGNIGRSIRNLAS
ncbi:uncharacterized protein LOC141632859 [Silene latifolia]|uniref:uncharacterized protein LOC141632859 n=1 Tax=Silene latifolia TaxID=37657 RepID=UPI003D780726